MAVPAPSLLSVLETNLGLDEGFVYQVMVCLSFQDHVFLNILQGPRQLLLDAGETTVP